MTARFAPEQLVAADRRLARAAEELDSFVTGFPALAENHEFTAAVMDVYDRLDNRADVDLIQRMLAVAVARLAQPARPTELDAVPGVPLPPGVEGHAYADWNDAGPDLPAHVGPRAAGLVDAGMDPGIVDDFMGGAA